MRIADAATRHQAPARLELTGTSVPRIGYGMGKLARAAADSDGRKHAVELLRTAYDLGVRVFDTAQFYGNGLANELIAEALGEYRSDIVIATKAGTRPEPDGPVPVTAAQQPHELRAAVEANLESLRTDHLDLVYLRRMDVGPGVVAEGSQIVDMDEQLATMNELREAGLIRGIGLSHINARQLAAGLDFRLAAVENVYSLLARDDEDMLRTCTEHGIVWMPYFPLGGGGIYAQRPKVVDDPVVQRIAREKDATPSQVGLAWQLAHNPLTVLIPGTSSDAHLKENVAAAGIEFTQAQLRELNSGS